MTDFNFLSLLSRGGSKVLRFLDAITNKQQENHEQVMSAIADLKTSVARLSASTSAEIKAVSDKLSALPTDDPAIAEAVVSLNATADTLDAETATLTAASGATV